MNVKNVFFCFCTVYFISACTSSSDNPDYAATAVCTGTTPSYSDDVSAIINGSCASSGCHDANSKQNGIDLSTYATAKTQFLNNDKNLTSIHHGSGVKPMPFGGAKLSDDIINKLDCWVKNGCPL